MDSPPHPHLLRDLAESKFNQYQILGYLHKEVKENPLLFVLSLRFVLITPFNLINFLFGLTPIHWFPYTLGTFFGILLGTFAYTWLGVSGLEALQGRDRVSFFLALGFLALYHFDKLALHTNPFFPPIIGGLGGIYCNLTSPKWY
ncbi:TVP38/TMEM64 family protein [Dactylococcopsis salina]|uniref:TVP38/TMEM64 family protein n=1 Tax=Dactylococcopsis salina TaxID=292566 RepID=UPI000307AA85|nr:VTT domain-containing protein [Dactylococcopsis salina]